MTSKKNCEKCCASLFCMQFNVFHLTHSGPRDQDIRDQKKSVRKKPRKCKRYYFAFCSSDSKDLRISHFPFFSLNLVTSMLVTDIGDKMCWWLVTSPTSKVRHQNQISVTNITFWRIMMTDWNVTNIQKNVTPILFCHHLKMITIIKSPT